MIKNLIKLNAINGWVIQLLYVVNFKIVYFLLKMLKLIFKEI